MDSQMHLSDSGAPNPAYPIQQQQLQHQQHVTEDSMLYNLSSFFNSWDPPPPAVLPPSDPELQKRIDKLAEYAAKNGPKFESLMREKQNRNPAYAFLNGGEGYGYYRYILWVTIQTHAQNQTGKVQTLPPQLQTQPQSVQNFPPNQMYNSQSYNSDSIQNPSAYYNKPSTFTAQSYPRPQYFNDYQQTNSVQGNFPYASTSYDNPSPSPSATPTNPTHIPNPSTVSNPSTATVFGYSLPPEVASEAFSVLDNLTGTKESIKTAKAWFMQKVVFAFQLGELFKQRVFALTDSEKQLHILYLLNDILFNSLQNRTNPTASDPMAEALRPNLGPILSKIFHSSANSESNQGRLRKIIEFWGAKELYSMDIIKSLENEMLSDPSLSSSTDFPPSFPTLPSPHPSLLPSATASMVQNPWQQPDLHQSSANSSIDSSFNSTQQSSSAYPSPFTTTPYPTPNLTPNLSSGLATNLTSNLTPNLTSSLNPGLSPAVATAITPAGDSVGLIPVTSTAAEQPPYPLFPPGLIPGMVRKMQIGSGVPYSPMSPLDIPTSIPSSTVSESFILSRVTKFFREINEVDPLAGEYEEREEREEKEERREYPQALSGGMGRGGGISPPHMVMEVDPETGALPDGSVETRSGLGSERLGLGATADPMEATQYDDVYSSYRRHRSSNYHSSMSVRSALKYEHA